jgi:type I restriction-modification system DNA methylase subunit
VPRNKTKANYLWINLFATSLKPAGRAALVMANSASDARHSEADIRRPLKRPTPPSPSPAPGSSAR